MKKLLTVALSLTFIVSSAAYAQTGGPGESKPTKRAPAKTEKAQPNADAKAKAADEKKKADDKKKDPAWDWGNFKKAEAPKTQAPKTQAPKGK